MSRPFSYNDENFTVIDNLLFCHIKLSKTIQVGEPIVEVPPAIYNRLLYTTNSMSRQLSKIGVVGGYFSSVGVKELNRKYYFYSDALINGEIYSYLTGIFYIKDI